MGTSKYEQRYMDVSVWQEEVQEVHKFVHRNSNRSTCEDPTCQYYKPLPPCTTKQLRQLKKNLFQIV